MKHTIDISDFVPVISLQSVKSSLAERFKKRRKEVRITQKELSEKSGISYGSIRRFEQTGEISLHGLLRISEVIGCLDEFNALFTKPIIRSIRR